MRLVLFGFVVLLLLLAGCFEPSDAGEAPAVDIEPSVLEEYVFEESGEGAVWVLLELPFAEPVTNYSGEYQVKLVVEGEEEGPAVLAFHDPALYGSGSMSLAGIEPWAFRYDDGGGGLEWERHRGFSGGSSQGLEGMFFTFVVTGAWSAFFSVEGLEFDPLGVDERVVPVDVDAWDEVFSMGDDPMPVVGAGSVETDVPTAGWTHADLVMDRLQPTGARVMTIEFPDGSSSLSGTGYSYGLECLEFRSNKRDYWGMPAGEPGVLSATLVYAEAVLEAHLRVVHVALPVDQWPAYVDAGSIYTGRHETC